MNNYSLPTAEEQLAFLEWIQRLFTEGEFSATYKFALIMALTDLAIELGDDCAEPLTITMTSIAEKFAELYWDQTVPYSTPGSIEHSILFQNLGKQAGVVNQLVKLREDGISNLNKARLSKNWKKAIQEISKTVYEMPVKHLQNLSGKEEAVLYELPSSKNSLTLKPKIAFYLRRYQNLIQQLARGMWLEHVKKNRNNFDILGPSSDLESFMFHSSRNSLLSARNILRQIQGGKCFYCGKSIRQNPEVDHFIPWSRYPRDLGHNFVLSHGSCNRSKSDWLASKVHLEHWVERNILHGSLITEQFSEIGFIVDSIGSNAITKWAYQQAVNNKLQTWVVGKKYETIKPDVMDIFS